MSRLRPAPIAKVLPPTTNLYTRLGLVLGLAALCPATATAEPEPGIPAGEPAEGSEPATPEAEKPPPDVVTPQPEPEPVAAICDPSCPGGSVCIEGQCFVACDPGSGDCEAPLATPDVEPELILEPAPAPAPEPADDLLGLGLRIAPFVGACLGSGCRRVRVGSSGGSMNVGGGLDLRFAYRAARHLSVEAGAAFSAHGNDIDDDPFTMWLSALVGPRLHLSGGRWRAEPVIGLQVGYARTLVRWSNAGISADGLALGADAGVQFRINQRVSLGMLTGLVLPYWSRVCDVNRGVSDCYRRSELGSADLRRYLWTTSAALLVRF